MRLHDKINVIFGFSRYFTYIFLDFVFESEFRKMASDVIMAWYFRYPISSGKNMVIFGFSVSNYIYLVTCGRKKIANFQSLGPPLGLSHAQVKVITEVRK